MIKERFREVKEFDVAGFGSRLKALRETAGMNQTQLGKRVGISRGSLCFYETGERMPTLDIACKLAAFFGVSITYLCGEKGSAGYEWVNRAVKQRADMMQAFREIQKLLGNVETEMAPAKEIVRQNGEDRL